MIPRIALAWLAVLLAVPLAPGRDEPKKATPKEQYAALVKEFATERQMVLAEAQKVKGEEQQKLYQKYSGLGKEYADKFLKLAADHPKDPVATDALFWVLQNGGTESKKAEPKVVALIPDMKLEDLRRNLPPIANSAGVYEAIAKRVEKEEKDPLVPDVLGWLATTRAASPKAAEIAKAATTRLVEKFPDNPAVGRICQSLASSRDPAAAAQLKAIAAKTTSPKVKAEAAFAIGQLLSGKLNDHADTPAELQKAVAEAEKAMAEAADLFGKADMKARKDAAQAALTAFRDNPVRVGKTAPEIEGKDLDGKEFKLSDYRGKVVLLDFWGDW